jgi:hypothetical protein
MNRTKMPDPFHTFRQYVVQILLLIIFLYEVGKFLWWLFTQQ